MACRFGAAPSISAAIYPRQPAVIEPSRQKHGITFSPRRGGSLKSLVLIAACLVLSPALMSQVSGGEHNAHTQSAYSSSIVDPDIVDSEWNHHLAGYILIGIALLVFVGQRSSKLTLLQALWPFLFIAAGLFLAVWSDKEIWPRGFLSWTWLIHHDAEARQHKIYAILLLAMGIIEYLRWRGKLSQFWRIWSFPLLALLGAGLLLVHDHGGNSGLPPGWDAQEKAARIAKMAAAAGLRSTPADPMMGTGLGSEHAMAMPTEDHTMPDMTSMAASSRGNPSSMAAAPSAHQGHEGHVMTSSMLHVKKQHLWFTLVGIAVAVLKFVADTSFGRRLFAPHLWPCALTVLGVLLALYTE
jgi:hypothetical protein